MNYGKKAADDNLMTGSHEDVEKETERHRKKARRFHEERGHRGQVRDCK